MVTSADITTLCKTKYEANLFQEEIEVLLSLLFTNISFEKIVEEKLPYEQKMLLLSLLRKNTINLTNTSEIQTFLQELKRGISEMPIVSIGLAFAPKKETIEMLSTWFAVHIKKSVLLDITVNTTLLGGAIISHNGIYKDYSVKHILEEKYKQGELKLQ